MPPSKKARTAAAVPLDVEVVRHDKGPGGPVGDGEKHPVELGRDDPCARFVDEPHRAVGRAGDGLSLAERLGRGVLRVDDPLPLAVHVAVQFVLAGQHEFPVAGRGKPVELRVDGEAAFGVAVAVAVGHLDDVAPRAVGRHAVELGRDDAASLGVDDAVLVVQLNDGLTVGEVTGRVVGRCDDDASVLVDVTVLTVLDHGGKPLAERASPSESGEREFRFTRFVDVAHRVGRGAGDFGQSVAERISLFGVGQRADDGALRVDEGRGAVGQHGPGAAVGKGRGVLIGEGGDGVARFVDEAQPSVFPDQRQPVGIGTDGFVLRIDDLLAGAVDESPSVARAGGDEVGCFGAGAVLGAAAERQDKDGEAVLPGCRGSPSGFSQVFGNGRI